MNDIWPKYQPFEITKETLLRQNEENLQLICNLEIAMNGYFEVGSDFKKNWHIYHNFRNDEPLSLKERYGYTHYTFENKELMIDWILENIDNENSKS